MPKDMGMIAFGMVQQLKKRVLKLEEQVEEVTKQIRVKDTEPTEESKGSV